MSGLQRTHIFFVVVRQGEFSVWQNKLPLQKLCVVFSFLPQHSFIITWSQTKKLCETLDLRKVKIFVSCADILERLIIWPVFTSRFFRYMKNRFFLHSSACVWGTTYLHLSYTRQTVFRIQWSPIVYATGGYWISPVNSILSYLARIHWSLRTLQFKDKYKKSVDSQNKVLLWHKVSLQDLLGFDPSAGSHPYFTSTVVSCTSLYFLAVSCQRSLIGHKHWHPHNQKFHYGDIV